uniref:Malic enzyme n=1 Tax=Gouania willdenowi TaxID=441366 RepID=A0A8C5G573_GOUWI
MARRLVGRESLETETQRCEEKGTTLVHTKKKGYEIIRNPLLNKGMAFTLGERLQLGIHGLLPPCFVSQDVQLLRVLKNYDMKKDDLDRYVFLMGLQDRNEKLFYRVIMSNVERFMPIIYTPTVGLACQLYGHIFRRPRGLFITIHDRGHIAAILKNWPEINVRVVCVTDGERILGLGDLGCHGMGIPVGKLALYTACGGVPPQQCLPVTLDVGTDNEVRKLVQLILEQTKYGMDCLIQFEDFANINAFRMLNKYRNKFCTFNDDIQGTAAVAVAGLLAALRITKTKMCDHTIVFQGAGEAAMGIAELVTMAMEKEGLPKEEGLKKIWMVDSKGLIVKGRDQLTHEKERFAHEHQQMKKLEDVVRELKPTVIIGVAAVSRAFTEQIIRDMASFNERPIIFALSNPTSKAECTAEQCYTLTEGRAIFASGSPFDPVTLPDGRTFYPGQGNNSYIFPGVGLGVIACGLQNITEEVFLTAAEALANLVTDKDLAEGRLFPPLSSIRNTSLKLAAKIMEFAFEHNVASLRSEPSDKEAHVRSLAYSTDYDEFVVDSYRWPEDCMTVQACKL